MQTNLTPSHATRIAAIVAMGDRLSAKSGKSSADVEAMLGQTKRLSPFHLDAQRNAQIDAWGVDTSLIFNANTNPKVAKRFVQFAGAIAEGQCEQIDMTTARILYALKLAGNYALTTDALAYCVTGRLSADAVAPNTRGISTRVIGRLFARVGLTTAPTQISRSVGDNGFLTLSGATHSTRGETNRPHTLNHVHPMVRAFFSLVDNATDSQLNAMVGNEG